MSRTELPSPAPSPRHRLAAAAIFVAATAALCVLAAITPWTPDEATYVRAGRLIVGELDWDPYIAYAHGPLPFYANQLFAWAVPAEPIADYKLAGRLGMLGFALLGALATWRFAGTAFGPSAGVLALALYALNPVLLAHGPLMATDTSLVGFYLLALLAAWRWSQQPGALRAAAIGAWLGLALATKYLGVFLVPVLGAWLVWLCARRRAPRAWLSRRREGAAWLVLDLLLAAGLCALVAWLVLWACYAFAPPGYAPSNVPRSAFFARAVALPGVPALLATLPEPWVRGVDYMKAFSESGGDAYLCGRIGPGFLGYYAASLLTKLPLAMLALLPLALLPASLGRPPRRPTWPRHLASLTALAVAVPFVYLSTFQVLQIGLRHMLQVVPLLCIVAARPLAAWWDSGRNAGRVAVAAVLAWLAVDVARAWPDLLGAFNAIAAERPYHWFRDSNLTWRGDLEPDPDERAIRARHPGADRVFVASGPRLGRVIAQAPDLCLLAGPDGRASHWLFDVEPIDRAGAWYAFDVDDRSFDLARRRPVDADRVRTDHAIALATGGDAQRALDILGDASDPRAGHVRDLAARVQAQRTDDAAFASLLQALGRFDLLAAHPAASPLQRATAHFQRGERERARDLLRDAVDDAGAGDPAAALLLAVAHHQLNEHAACLDVLERGAPRADHPLAEAFERLRIQVADEYRNALDIQRRLERIAGR